MAASTAVALEDRPRQPSAADRRAEIASLTGLRGFAALMVVVIHSAGRTDFPGFGVQGYGPVALFTLSGFLLFRPWSRWMLGTGSRPSIRLFARRRVLRIFPAYLVVLLAFAVMYPPSQPRGLDGWARALTLTGIYASDGLRPGLEQTWSLGTELSWYVALPVMGLVTGWIARRLGGSRGLIATVALLALSVPIVAGWRYWVHLADLGRYFTYPFWLPAFLVCFAGGALIAHLVEAEAAGVVALHRARAVAADPWLIIALAMVVGLIGTSSLGGPDLYTPSTFDERQVRFVCATAIALLLLFGAVLRPSGGPLVGMLASRWLNAVGRWSYGIYLWHLPVIVLIEDDFVHRTGPGGFALWLACILGVAVPLGAATYAWVEKPVNDWSRRLPSPRS